MNKALERIQLAVNGVLLPSAVGEAPLETIVLLNKCDDEATKKDGIGLSESETKAIKIVYSQFEELGAEQDFIALGDFGVDSRVLHPVDLAVLLRRLAEEGWFLAREDADEFGLGPRSYAELQGSLSAAGVEIPQMLMYR